MADQATLRDWMAGLAGALVLHGVLVAGGVNLIRLPERVPDPVAEITFDAIGFTRAAVAPDTALRAAALSEPEYAPAVEDAAAAERAGTAERARREEAIEAIARADDSARVEPARDVAAASRTEDTLFAERTVAHVHASRAQTSEPADRSERAAFAPAAQTEQIVAPETARDIAAQNRPEQTVAALAGDNPVAARVDTSETLGRNEPDGLTPAAIQPELLDPSQAFDIPAASRPEETVTARAASAEAADRSAPPERIAPPVTPLETAVRTEAEAPAPPVAAPTLQRSQPAPEQLARLERPRAAQPRAAPEQALATASPERIAPPVTRVETAVRTETETPAPPVVAPTLQRSQPAPEQLARLEPPRAAPAAVQPRATPEAEAAPIRPALPTAAGPAPATPVGREGQIARIVPEAAVRATQPEIPTSGAAGSSPAPAAPRKSSGAAAAAAPRTPPQAAPRAAPRTALVAPLRRVPSVSAPADAAAEAYRRTLRFIERVDLGACFLALPVADRGERLSIFSFADNPENQERFAAAIRAEPGLPRHEPIDRISQAQCRTLAFARGLPRFPAFTVAIAIEQAHIRSGQALEGDIRNVGARMLHLLLVDDEGVVQDVEPFLRRTQAGDPSFFAPLVLTGEPDTRTQLLVAIASDVPLETVTRRTGMLADDFFAALEAEMIRSDADIDIAIQPFSVRP